MTTTAPSTPFARVPLATLELLISSAPLGHALVAWLSARTYGTLTPKGTAQRVYDAVRASAYQIAQDLGRDYRAVRRALASLLDRGVVHRRGAVWSLAPITSSMIVGDLARLGRRYAQGGPAKGGQHDPCDGGQHGPQRGVMLTPTGGAKVTPKTGVMLTPTGRAKVTPKTGVEVTPPIYYREQETLRDPESKLAESSLLAGQDGGHVEQGRGDKHTPPKRSPELERFRRRWLERQARETPGRQPWEPTPELLDLVEQASPRLVEEALGSIRPANRNHTAVACSILRRGLDQIEARRTEAAQEPPPPPPQAEVVELDQDQSFASLWPHHAAAGANTWAEVVELDRQIMDYQRRGCLPHEADVLKRLVAGELYIEDPGTWEGDWGKSVRRTTSQPASQPAKPPVRPPEPVPGPVQSEELDEIAKAMVALDAPPPEPWRGRAHL